MSSPKSGLNPFGRMLVILAAILILIVGAILHLYTGDKESSERETRSATAQMATPAPKVPTAVVPQQCSMVPQEVVIGTSWEKIEWGPSCQIHLNLVEDGTSVLVATGPDTGNLKLETSPNGFKKGDFLEISTKWGSVWFKTLPYKEGVRTTLRFILCPKEGTLRQDGCLYQKVLHKLDGTQAVVR